MKTICKPFRFAVILLTVIFFSAITGKAQLAGGADKFLGNIWYGANEPANFSSLWNQVTPENDTKWEYCEPSRGNWNFSTALAQYNYCKSRGIPFKFHTLVWQQQYPASWLEALYPYSLKKDATEEWIKKAGETFPNADYVDVVNEATHINPYGQDVFPGYFYDLGGFGTTGWDYVVWSFQKARQYFPNSKLLINDYGILTQYTNIDRYMNIISILKSKGLIDGIGCQAHFLENCSASYVKGLLDKLATLGLPIYISEFDLNIADDTEQKNKMVELFPVFWQHPAVKGVTFWGYLQGYIWQPNAILIRADGTERPALTWLKNYMNSQYVSGGTYRITPKFSGKSLDISGASTANGAALQQYTYWGGSNQQFVITDVGSGYSNIVSVNSGKALDVAGSYTDNGTPIQQWEYGGASNQQWQLVPTGDGYYQIVSRSSGKCLDVVGPYTADGTPIQQWTYWGGSNQQFGLTRINSLKSAKVSEIEPVEDRNEFSLYPNPSADGVFTIVGKGVESQLSVSIFNIKGNVVYRNVNTSTNMPVTTGLKSGLYIVRTTKDNATQTMKLIVK